MTQLDHILRAVSRPARYTGGEWNSVRKDWESVQIRIALAYPDTYEIGMSNMGIAILYDLLNRRSDVLAERVYAPWTDMAAQIRQEAIPLFSLESQKPLGEFDIIGFSLGYELTYTNVLIMLDLAGIPVLASQRNDALPLIIAGGTCALNLEPMSDFIDLFVVGEGEEVILELIDAFGEWKAQGFGKKQELLQRLGQIQGVYAPSLQDPAMSERPKVKRRIVSELPPPLARPVLR